jgi:glyoxylase-like metal-dependent hydrolase (beta-lactamase superfamily II)
MLVELGSRVAVIPGGVNVGLLRGAGGRLVLIDTGLNETSGKKALKTAREEAGGEVVAILTTHAHADHFGANAAVVKRTGARVYAPAFDEAILRYPLLQPISLYGGADPLDTLRGGFLLADPSPVDQIVAPGPLTVEGIELVVVPLHGHSPGQVGYLVDGIFFCADVVLPASVLDKYRIPYLFSVTDHLAALERASRTECRIAAPGHGAILETPTALADLIEVNRSLVDDVTARVLTLAASSTTAEAILTGLLTHFGAAVADAPGFYLLQPTVFAFLSHLHRLGQIRHEVRQGQSLWTAT